MAQAESTNENFGSRSDRVNKLGGTGAKDGPTNRAMENIV
jgi:hypothetical protein